MAIGLRSIIKIFEKGNTCVTGLRGDGKDMLIANVVSRRSLPYSSNVDYGGEFISFDPSVLSCGGNTYKHFLNNDCLRYSFPYCDGTDIYISDAGVYFPSQYCSELNRLYPHFPTFFALSRHLGLCNVHINVQNLNRCWDKIREQSDQYIRCLGCRVLGGYVFQRVRLYDKYESCVDRVKPFRVNMPLIGSGATRYQVRLARDQYEATHGRIKDKILIYKNKSSYDTRIFKRMLEEGKE